MTTKTLANCRLRMNAIHLCVIGSVFGIAQHGWSTPYLNGSTGANQNWAVSLSSEVNSRHLEGTLVNRSNISENQVFGTFLATGDSMNLGREYATTVYVSARYNKWVFGFQYLPTSFSGLGTAQAELEVENFGGFVSVPVESDIRVDMLFGKVSYNLINEEDRVFGIGLGVGQLHIDLNVTPDVGSYLIYREKQPFGYLNFHMANRHERFYYGFTINAIKIKFEEIAENFSDYKIDFGYRMIDTAVKWDILAGYRLMNIEFDMHFPPNTTSADVQLKGPFLGLSVSY